MSKLISIIALVAAGVFALWGGITLASQQGGGAGVPGSYPVEFNLQSDICLHDQFIWGQGNPPPHNIKLTLDVNGTTLIMSGPSPVVQVIDETFNGTNINAQGSGTVAGFQNTVVTFVGTYNNGVITGKYTFGNTNPPGQGGLPPCPPAAPVSHPAVYGVKPKPTTPTPTPLKLYSIIVIKLNNDTVNVVPGWRIDLYTGSNCQGNSIDHMNTDDKGMVDFEGLDVGNYSVKEESRTGWNPVGAICKNVTLPDDEGTVAGATPPPCPIQPDADFPEPGCDTFASAARVKVKINATGAETDASLGGPVQIKRTNSPTDKDQDGLDEVNTEMVFMELTSSSGITVRESPTRASTGKIEEQANTTPNHMDFPADSFFDIFFEVDIGGVTLHNNEALHIACKIDAVPPYKCLYEPTITTPIVLYDANDVKIAKLTHGLHIPIPPNEAVVIFTNKPKGTPTVTATPTRTRTPTATPHDQTPTATPTNPPPNGTCAKTEQNISYQNKIWDQWKCTPSQPAPFVFNRIDVFVGSSQVNPILSAVHFVCQHTNQKVEGVFKVHKPNVYPGTNLPNADIWSGEFDPKCDGGVTVYVQTVSAAAHANILQVAFTDNQTPTPTATLPPQETPTATPRPHNGDANKDGTTNAIDAALVLQYSAGLIGSVNDSSDVNEDGTKNPLDSLLILQYSAGLIPSLPI